jgi:hypothetical protein
MAKKTCPSCHGNGFFTALVDGPNNRGMTHITCSACQGAGELDEKNALWLRIGSTHRTWRIAQHEGLSACAERLGIEDRLLNDQEHGRADPTALLADIPEILRELENLQPPAQEAA